MKGRIETTPNHLIMKLIIHSFTAMEIQMEATQGFIGDSHSRRMAGLIDQDNRTFSHTSLHAIHFSKTNQLKRCIQQHPNTKTILYSFGGNDIDSPFMNTEEHYERKIAKAIITILKDTFFFGVLPFIVSIIRRTKSNHRVGILDFKWAKTQIERRIANELQHILKYNPIIYIDHLVSLKHDGTHPEDFSYIEITDTCREYITKTLNNRAQIDTNNNSTWNTTAISTNSVFTLNSTTTITTSFTNTAAAVATVTTNSTAAATTNNNAATAIVTTSATATAVTTTSTAAAVTSTAASTTITAAETNTTGGNKRSREESEDKEWEETMEVEHITTQVRNLLLRGTPTLRTMATQTSDTAGRGNDWSPGGD